MAKLKKPNKKEDWLNISTLSPQTWLKIAHLRAEKCELNEAEDAFLLALKQAKKESDLKSMMEAISGLLRMAGEALDEKAIEKWDGELDRLMSAYPKQIPPMAWYCKGAVARHKNELKLAQRFFHRYLRAVRALAGDQVQDQEWVARGWTMLAIIMQQRNCLKRSRWLANEVLKRYESQDFRGINGIVYILEGTLSERACDYKSAMQWFQKAHTQFLGEHNWYYHLYVLYGYARIARHQQNYPQAYWYLDLIDKATSSTGFGSLRKELANERTRLQQDAIDILIDSNKGVIKTRAGKKVSLRKQYVLLNILEALSQAHSRIGGKDRGLSKAEIIEFVWKENYQPNLHDNKLYYNINRLRKLIEPDVRKPRYLLNWKKGYRLAPGLRIQFVGERSAPIVGENHERQSEKVD
jgi:DNA-binding winged helix-turn-helix (wHTH) protein